MTFIEDALHVTKPPTQSTHSLQVGVQFPEEPEVEPFKFKGQDLFEKLREDVRRCREAF